MSPKSRGRPKGRGRHPARRSHDVRHLPAQQPGVDEPLNEILDEVSQLVDHAVDLLSAQELAAAWLGQAWATRDLNARDPERALVSDLIAATKGRRAESAYRALQILATVPGETWRADIAVALARRPAGAVPHWAVDLETHEPERPVDARCWTDPWDEERVYVLRYEDPRPHSLLVVESRVGGLTVTAIGVSESTTLEDAVSDGLRLRDTDVDEALRNVADALRMTKLYWPPVEELSYVMLRALAEWRTRGWARDKDWEPIDDAARQALIDAFVETRPGEERTLVELLADTFIDFGEGYRTGDVLGWGPGSVEQFMLDWVHRKVILEADATSALPDVLRGWVRFALERRGCAPDDVEPVVRAVGECEPDYRQLLDEDAGGPAKQIVSRLLAAGVDLQDKDAVDAAIRAYNAELLARRLLGEGPP